MPLSRILVASSLTIGAFADPVSQYLGLGPETGIVSWKKATFPANYTATSVDEVTIEDVTETIDQLGAWQDLNVHGIPLLTMKTYGNKLYSQLNTYVAPLGPSDNDYYQGGCCCDSFRSFAMDDNGNYESYDVMNTVFNVMENTTDIDKNTGTPFAYANHVFDMVEIDNSVVAMLAITYHEPALDFSEVEAVIFYDTTTSNVIQTKDGEKYFSFYQHLGTLSTDPSDSIYKLMFTYDGPEQFHMNGITRFQTNDGTWILAVTFRASAECVLIKCPYTYKASDGGGTILQRFGTPPGHRFGYSTSEGSINAMHNMYHTVYPETNKETLTLFVNSQTGYTNSRIFEFEVKLTPQPETGDDTYDDTIFDTSYISGTTDFYTGMWGGGRPIGQGVWLVGFEQIQVIDQNSNPEESALSNEEMEVLKKKQDELFHQKQLVKANKVNQKNKNRKIGVTEFDDDMDIPWDDDAFTVYNIYDPFTFLVAN